MDHNIKMTLKEYTELVSSVPENKPYNKLGSAVNRIMCYYENIILQHAITRNLYLYQGNL